MVAILPGSLLRDPVLATPQPRQEYNNDERACTVGDSRPVERHLLDRPYVDVESEPPREEEVELEPIFSLHRESVLRKKTVREVPVARSEASPRG